MRSFLLAALVALATAQLAPGSMEVTLSIPSLSNIVGLFAGILPSYLINNKTLELNYTDSGFGYSINLKDLHVGTLNINKRSIEFLPGTKTVRLLFSEINVDANINGKITFIGLIDLNAAHVNLTNLTLQADLEAVPMADGSARWQLKAASFADLTDITLNTTSPAWNAIIAPFHTFIRNIVVMQLPKISAYLGTIVDGLNAKMARGDDFMVNLFDPRFPLNMTTTQPPQADSSTKVVTLNFDGTFYDVAAKTNHVAPSDNNPDRLPGMGSNQIFLHQSMVASLFMALE